MVDLTWLEFAGSLGFTVALVPQFVTTLRRKRANDMDVTFLLIVLLSSLVLLVYSLATRQYYFAASYVANLLVWSVVLYFRLRPGFGYREPREGDPLVPPPPPGR